MAGGKQGAKKVVEPPYEYQEYPKVLYADDGEHRLINSAKEELRLLKNSKKSWATSPADHLPEGHPDRSDTVDDTVDGDEESEEAAAEELAALEAKMVGGDAAKKATKAAKVSKGEPKA
jgi:hypothetical protein